MKKRIIASVLIVALMATCLLAFAACDKDEVPAEFEMPVGDRPDKASLISAEDQAIIDKGLAESAKDDDNEKKDQDAIKAAVMALYNTANRSRIETPISLVVQESDAGISMGAVLMHAINIRNGEKWYYQLATEVQSSSPLINTIMNYAAGFLTAVEHRHTVCVLVDYGKAFAPYAGTVGIAVLVFRFPLCAHFRSL